VLKLVGKYRREVSTLTGLTISGKIYTAQALEASTAELLGSEAKPERGKPRRDSTASTAV
jgi:hypothetical protein